MNLHMTYSQDISIYHLDIEIGSNPENKNDLLYKLDKKIQMCIIDMEKYS